MVDWYIKLCCGVLAQQCHFILLLQNLFLAWALCLYSTLVHPGTFARVFLCLFSVPLLNDVICEHMLLLGVTDCRVHNFVIVRGGA